MARIYIANTSNQNQIVYYRLDIVNGDTNLGRFQPARQLPSMPPGRQQPFPGDYEMPQIESIIAQLTRVGLVAEMDVNNGLPNGTVPYVYNIGQPVSIEAIRAVMNHNNGIITDDGRERREAAAVAASEAMGARVVAENYAAPEEFETTVEQLDTTETSPVRLEEGTVVPRDKPTRRKGR